MSTSFSASHLLVDMDGTLADSAPAIAKAWRLWSEQYDIAPPDLSAALGGSSVDTVRQLVSPDLVDEALESITKYELSTAPMVTATAGAKTFTESLAPNYWSLVTSSRRTVALARIKATGITPPNSIITADDYINGKPAPDPYLTALSRLQMTQGRIAAIEDSRPGINSARAAGLEVIGILTYSTREELADAQWIINSFMDLAVKTTKGHNPIKIRIA